MRRFIDSASSDGRSSSLDRAAKLSTWREELKARSTGNHCGEHASRCVLGLHQLLFATLGFVVCGMEAVQMAATTPMSARKLEAYLFTYTLRWRPIEGTLQGQDARYPGTRQSSRKRVAQLIAASLRPGSSGGVAA